MAAMTEEDFDAIGRIDLEWARRKAGFIVMQQHRTEMPPDEVLLMAMHKTRHWSVRFDRALRIESGQWLIDRKYGALEGDASIDVLPFDDDWQPPWQPT